MTHDEIGRLVGGDRFPFAPLPELAQDRQGGAVEKMAAFDAPDRFHVGRAIFGSFVDQPGARLLMPGQAFLALQFGF